MPAPVPTPLSCPPSRKEPRPRYGPRQATFDDALHDAGRSLAGVVFVVVDLETTGGSAADCEITEIGAVKVQGGQVLGEFQTLVRPAAAIPSFISVLTGITDSMVASAPRLSAALPAFLEFAHGAVLIAHNAPFDLGFLRTGCQRLGIEWPGAQSVDTARLARRVLTRDETPDCKLASLATLFRASVRPCHRALADARATVDVLHGLFERLGTIGVTTMEELASFSSLVPDGVRRKRHLADPLPSGPGVYIFRDAAGRALYVGTSRNLRARVRTYFTAAEPRARMAEMVRIAERVDAVPCSTVFEEAAVHRDRLLTFVRAAARMQRLVALTALSEVVAAAPTPEAGWELAVVRHGRLTACGVVPRGAAVRPYVDALLATAEQVTPGPGPLPCASAEETECVLRWLERPGVRLIASSGAWCSPAHGAQGQRRLLASQLPGAGLARPRALGAADGGRLVSRPARAAPRRPP